MRGRGGTWIWIGVVQGQHNTTSKKQREMVVGRWVAGKGYGVQGEFL